MTNNAVTRKIRLLKEIKPNPDWLESQRRILLLNIESGKKTKFSWNYLPGFLMPKTLLKPVGISLIIVILIFGGGFFTVKAYQNSLPGDLLYPVKLGIEELRIKFSSIENKPELEADFVVTRAKELSQIIESPNDFTGKKEKITMVIDKLQSQVIDARNQLSQVERTQPEKANELAKVMSEKTSKATEVLIKAKEKIAEKTEELTPEKEEITQAIDNALAVILAEENISGKQKESEIEPTEEEPVESEEPIIISPTEILPENQESQSINFEQESLQEK